MMTMSILGLYNFDHTLFDGMQLPDGVDRETLINNILMEAAELEVIYPSAPMMRFALDNWSKANFWNWTELYKTTQYEYDPIANYDRTERWTEKETRKTAFENSATGSSSNTNTSTQADDSDVTSNNSVSGYDSPDMVPSEKTVQNTVASSTVSGSSSNTANSTNTGTTDDTNDVLREGRAYGNIGVTTTQQMIESQRDVLKFNIYKHIASAFIDRFCIGVW